jgi:hypothetical protein
MACSRIRSERRERDNPAVSIRSDFLWRSSRCAVLCRHREFIGYFWLQLCKKRELACCCCRPNASPARGATAIRFLQSKVKTAVGRSAASPAQVLIRNGTLSPGPLFSYCCMGLKNKCHKYNTRGAICCCSGQVLPQTTPQGLT